jgi:endonuclease/exonuclease/phosphatase family metal-dependent hydrolase
LEARIAAAKIPRARRDNLRLATWNIRELGRSPRLDASIAILARVIASFDLVSIVELRDDLTDLHRIVALLGRRWSFVCSDYLLDPKGNRERFAFLYRIDRVRFTGIASNAESRRKLDDRMVLIEQVPWWRLPFLASFEANGFAFLMIVTHVRWGESVPAREAEVAALGDWLAERRREIAFGGEHVFLLGDFNLSSKRSGVWEALRAKGLVEAPSLLGDPGSNLSANRRYDRIVCSAEDAAKFTTRAGTVDVYDGSFVPILPRTGLSWAQLTHQVSDHLPLWAEVATG